MSLSLTLDTITITFCLQIKTTYITSLHKKRETTHLSWTLAVSENWSTLALDTSPTALPPVGQELLLNRVLFTRRMVGLLTSDCEVDARLSTTIRLSAPPPSLAEQEVKLLSSTNTKLFSSTSNTWKRNHNSSFLHSTV